MIVTTLIIKQLICKNNTFATLPKLYIIAMYVIYGKDVICLGNIAAVQYQWTKELWNNKKLFVISFRFQWFLMPTYKGKNTSALVY